MRQKAVTYDEVLEASRKLKETGKECSAKSVRALLQKGSYSTITKHIKTSLTPPSSEDDTKDLWAEAFSHATSSFSEQKTAWEQQRQAILHVLDELESDKIRTNRIIREQEELIQCLRLEVEKQYLDLIKLVEQIKLLKAMSQISDMTL